MLVTADRPRNPANCPVHTPKLHAVPSCTCNNGVTLCSRRSSQRAADSASMPAPSGVSPLPASGCQKPQPHSSRHAKYNPVDSAAMSSDSQCGGARRQPCGESLTVRRTTPGAGRCSSGRCPLPTASESRKQASRGYKPSRSAICRRGASLNKAKSHQSISFSSLSLTWCTSSVVRPRGPPCLAPARPPHLRPHQGAARLGPRLAMPLRPRASAGQWCGAAATQNGGL